MLFSIESNRRKNNTIARVTLGWIILFCCCCDNAVLMFRLGLGIKQKGEENIMFWLEISDTAALNMVWNVPSSCQKHTAFVGAKIVP